MANTKASIITIGDELLIGQTIDTNSAWIAQQLNPLGIDIIRRVAVGDNKADIVAALDAELSRSEIVIITGGLGPTADDITKPLLAQYFGGKMVVDERVQLHVRSIFERRNLPLLEVNLRQAEVPESCTVLFNKSGTAPGMLFEKEGKMIISLPGVPHEMMGIVEDEVIPRLRQRFTSDAMVHRSVITAGLGESFLAEKIKDIESALPEHIRLAYLPGFWMVKLRLTGRGKDEMQLIREVDMRQEEIANRLEEYVVALEDLPMEEIVGRKLTSLGQTVALAESCTGGYLGHRLTQVIGSSKYFQGGIICYQYEVKEQLLGVEHALLEQEGAVNEAVALQMALGAQRSMKSDIGFGITGLLSPGGEEGVPVGTVWMAITNGDTHKTKAFHFPYDRVRNKEVAVNMALLMIWKFVNHQ